MRCYLFTSKCLIAAILAVAFLGNGALVAGNVVNVGVYYESLCPDSIRWIKNELLASYDTLKDYINVTLVPYGKASNSRDAESGEWRFSCQHGPEECDGNMAQACGIDAIQKDEQADKTQELAVALVGCAMSSSYPPSSVPRCAKKVGLKEQTQENIGKCIDGPLSKELLVANGEKTRALSPPLSFVPTIEINGVASQEIQSEALNNFFKLICDTLANGAKPSKCSSA